MQLAATKRTQTGKAVGALREAGNMPAIVYGPKQEATAITIPLRDFSKALEMAGESSVIQLMVDGAEHNVLIHEVDRDPVTGTPRHADFYAVMKGQKVKVNVQIEFTGIAPAVKELNANLLKPLHELEIEADAMNLPHEIIVDVSGLDVLNKQILAGDVPLPGGVTLVTGPEEVVATVVEAVEEKEEVVAVAPDMTTIGISEERGKKEEEEGGAEATEAKAE